MREHRQRRRNRAITDRTSQDHEHIYGRILGLSCGNVVRACGGHVSTPGWWGLGLVVLGQGEVEEFGWFGDVERFRHSRDNIQLSLAG